MADISVTVDTSDLKVLNDYLSKSTDKITLLASKASKDFDSLKRSIDPVYNAVQTFEGKVLTLQKALVTQAISQKEYADNFKLVQQQAERAGVSIDKFGKATVVNTGKLRRFGSFGMQQVGYQVQDFAVQVQSGTNALVALGQQGSQLLGIFGPTGAIAGMVLAIGTGLAGAFIAASQASKRAQQDFEATAKALGELEQAFRNAEQAAGGFGRLISSFNANDIVRAFDDIAKAFKEMGETTFMERWLASGSLLEAFGFMGNADADAIGQRFGEMFGVAAEFAAKQFNEDFFSSLEGAISSQDADALETFINSLSMFGNANADGEEFIRTLIEIRDQMLGYNEQVRTFSSEIADAFESGKSLFDLDLDISMQDAAAAAELIAEKLGISLRDATQMVNQFTMMQRISGSLLGIAGKDLLPPTTPEDKPSRGSRAKTPAEMLEEYMAKLENEVELKRSQVGLSEEAARVLELENQYKLRGVEVDNERIASIVAMEEETRKLTEAQKAAERQQEFYKDTLIDGMESIVDGSKSVNEAFRDMLRNMLLDIYRQKVITPAAEGIMSLFMAKGGAFNKGVQMFADGGVVSSPTMFGHSGGLGMMGEAGPEAIMPLKRGPDGKLGVAGSQGNVVVNQSFNFSANGDDSVKRIIAQAAPQIAQMTQKQIMDSRRRGGQMKATFS